jgi:hypothetical protein
MFKRSTAQILGSARSIVRELREATKVDMAMSKIVAEEAMKLEAIANKHFDSAATASIVADRLEKHLVVSSDEIKNFARDAAQAK